MTDLHTNDAPVSTDSIAPSATRRAALLVLHDSRGLDEVTRRTAAQFEQAGYAVSAPNLFARHWPPENAEEPALTDWTLSLSDSQIVADILAALDELASHPAVDATRLGVIGWGWSGAPALMAAAHDGRVRAVCDIAGDISYPVLTAKRPGSPLNFIANLNGALFAAYPGNDSRFPTNEVERLRARLIEHDKVGEVKIYEGAQPHFWHDAQAPQTVALWRRMTAFLATELALPGSLEEPTSDELQHEAGYPNEASRLHA